MSGPDAAVVVRSEAIAWVDDGWPGWLRVRLIDALGRPWHFVDKVPVFFSDAAPPPALPFPVLIRCRIADQDTDGVVTISTAVPDGVEAEDGTTVFRVRAAQVQRSPA
ncbi:hypothetical protein [Spirilliplanes yamanashiensis]|uniref:Uncharacterized protein n=1 Tax=Spirilliplanes yamanashiensis TaxID=42233 RepID=A0A8J3YD33_9ACTN|nr:hypothetical protein [Spirilliplanes yamanashiensis]MDP9815231.1 hypothetical protein [Spirilliplanes yamanashiensis]GIJ06501.1 hypothetical protein Sya03_58530 [Spirilliplanes yamanashiensis]